MRHWLLRLFSLFLLLHIPTVSPEYNNLDNCLQSTISYLQLLVRGIWPFMVMGRYLIVDTLDSARRVSLWYSASACSSSSRIFLLTTFCPFLRWWTWAWSQRKSSSHAVVQRTEELSGNIIILLFSLLASSLTKHTFNDKPRHVVLLVNECLLEGQLPPATEGEEKILDPLTESSFRIAPKILTLVKHFPPPSPVPAGFLSEFSPHLDLNMKRNDQSSRKST